jgi:hypothetical protein
LPPRRLVLFVDIVVVDVERQREELASFVLVVVVFEDRGGVAEDARTDAQQLFDS